MSRFKDAVHNDIKAVFLNLEEYGEWHRLNGVTVQCLIDENSTQGSDTERIVGVLANLQTSGVFANLQTIYVSADDIPAPVEGEILSIDGSMHLVKSVSKEAGMLVIVAEANEQ